ncbi:MAG: hypothetical protein AB1442_16265, partial [Nitrospirota bacterium]
LEEPNPKARDDEQEPDMRCDTFRASQHVTARKQRTPLNRWRRNRASGAEFIEETFSCANMGIK